MDAWKYAEVRGMLFSLLLKVDVLASENSGMKTVQERLEDALSFLEDLT